VHKCRTGFRIIFEKGKNEEEKKKKSEAVKQCGKWSKIQKYNKSSVLKYSTISPHIRDKLI